ncbi:hypothetical protein ACLOJK_040898 [Asimina triloba]
MPKSNHEIGQPSFVDSGDHGVVFSKSSITATVMRASGEGVPKSSQGIEQKTHLLRPRADAPPSADTLPTADAPNSPSISTPTHLRQLDGIEDRQ